MRAPKHILAQGGTRLLGSVTIALALMAMLAVMAIGVSAATAASPASGMYTTRAAGQLTPYVLIRVGRQHRIMMITLQQLRCMDGRLDMALGIRQRGGSFSITRRSGMFHVKTGKMLLGTDYRVRGRFTSPGAATGSARLISIPSLGARPCDSGWVPFRVTVMNPVEIWVSPGPTTFALPATVTEQVKILNRSTSTSKANRIALTLRALPFGTTALGSPPAPAVSTTQGHCSTPQWHTSDGLESTIACELGRLRPGQRAAVTVSSSFPSVPSPCTGGIDLSVVATIERATLNEPRSMPIENKESSFELTCPS